MFKNRPLRLINSRGSGVLALPDYYEKRELFHFKNFKLNHSRLPIKSKLLTMKEIVIPCFGEVAPDSHGALAEFPVLHAPFLAPAPLRVTAPGAVPVPPPERGAEHIVQLLTMGNA